MDDKDEERYNFLYAQLMKIFVSDSEMFNDSKLTEVELDENIITAKNTYVSINNDIYEVKTNIIVNKTQKCERDYLCKALRFRSVNYLETISRAFLSATFAYKLHYQF